MTSPFLLQHGFQDSLDALIEDADLPSKEKESIAAALRGVSMEPDPSFSPEVNERLATAGDNAQNAVASVPTPWPNVSRLLQSAYSAKTAGKRVFWINKAADALVVAYGPASACKPGCSHCCHIPVKLTKAEADAIGEAISRRPTPVEQHEEMQDEFSPCPLLHDNKCVAYAHRPSVCRSHLNMDVDDLLCRLVPGASIPVLYLDTRPLTMARVFTGGRSGMADIRQWFPRSIFAAKNT